MIFISQLNIQISGWFQIIQKFSGKLEHFGEPTLEAIEEEPAQ